ncbi:MAG: response regulator transcription factor [Candidatus Aminicenantes bacterium]|nr:MAG: response regulator transcription factor [Candidatus Aminicenantes bacterium]
MAKKILIVEDDPGISLGLKDEFESEGYDVWTVDNGEKGLEAVRNQKPDLIVLDIMLPVLDGYEVCKRLRMEGNRTPIIMLTVKDKEIDKVLGLELGADDYVTKPFSLRELLARAKAIFRRTEAQPNDLSTYSFGGIELDFKKYEATKKGGNLELTPLEYHLLKLLIQRKGEVLTRDDFLDSVWGEDNLSVSDRTVDSHIANIRKKLEDDPSDPQHIISVRGVGYKFVD